MYCLSLFIALKVTTCYNKLDKEMQYGTKKVGERIKKLRIELTNMSQEEFAKHIGVDRTYMSRLESGQKNPTLETLNKVCDGLNITLKVFFDFSDSDIESSRRKI